jgi:hypothetical protein
MVRIQRKIWIRSREMLTYDPDTNPAPDPSIIKQNYFKKTLIPNVL